MDIRWKAKEKANEEKIKQLSQSINISETLSSILIQRGIDNYELAEKFFRPKLTDLHNPFLMKDMDKAIARITQAVENKEKILVYGDYDVDGTTAVSIVYSFIRNLSSEIDFYIPDRYAEGYGISYAGIDFAANNNFQLIIALDCGIRSVAHIQYAAEKGIDFIICDHHLPGDEIPKAAAVLNPKQFDCPYPYKELSGCGIGYKLISALAEKMGLPEETTEEYLDLVAVSIASDLVDIRGENRILAYFGLKKLNENPSIGLQALLEGYMKKTNYTISDIVFGIGPRINAAGRIADAKAAVKVLIEKEFHLARMHTRVLNDRNAERKSLDNDITREAIEIIESHPSYLQKRSTVLKGETWQKGVIGIVASRLVEQYYKPTIVFAQNDGILTGSARSVKDFDIHEAIGACGEYVEQFGGHKYAAGLSVKVENFDAFVDKFENIVKENIHEQSLLPEIEYDAEIDISQISPKMLSIINQMAPFGPGNMFPIFKSDKLFSNGSARVLKDKHLKVVLKSQGQSLEGIGFNLSHLLEKVSHGRLFSACYSIEENSYNGRTSIQLRIRDIK